MAYQHFFSCVPARVSMFNKVDGYDTFAASDIFTKDYIEQNLMPMLDYRPGKAELPLIRTGQLPPSYGQYCGKQNQIIQVCVSFIPSDYTGERSSFMIHSLVLTDEERAAADELSDRQVLNPDMFVTDISDFKVTRASGSPKYNYPQVDYVTERITSVESLVTAYDPVPLKRFIYALLLIACGKGKTVYVTLNKPLAESSSAALNLMNTLLQVFPHNVRDNISFVTYLAEYNKLNMFDVKFLPRECMPPAGKGYVFNMTRTLADGIKDDDYRANEQVVNFFYGLLTDKPLRSRFVKFARHAVLQEPSMKQPTFKNLTALVTLFRQICKAFTEKQLLPDDEHVLAMFEIYEKYRSVLSPSERCLVYNSLTRYKRLHQPIPQKVFNKLCKLYPDEPEKVKVSVMRIVLDLIHTDVMRDKLFAFIKNNFDNESARSRSLICRNLVRVYYGGFLQPQILQLYNEHFGEESEGTQDYIFNRLMLSIRTPAVQQPLMTFLQKYYPVLTDNQKRVLYRTFFEMLPEADALAELIVDFVNGHIGKDDGEVVAVVSERLVKVVDVESRKSDALFALIFKHGGFCEKTVLSVLLRDWTNRKIFKQYCNLLVEGDFLRVADSLYNCFVAAPHAEKAVVSAVRRQTDDKMFANAQNCDFFRLASIADRYTRYLAKNDDGIWRDTCDKMVNTCLVPALKLRICDCFNHKQIEQCISQALAYADKYALVDADGYVIVAAAKQLLDGVGIYPAFAKLQPHVSAKRLEFINLANLAEAKLLVNVKDRVTDGADIPEICDASLAVTYLRTCKFDFDKVYQNVYGGFERMYARKAGSDSKAMQKVVAQATAESVAVVVESVDRLSSCLTDDTRTELLFGNGNDGLQKFVAKHSSVLGGAELATLRTRVETLSPDVVKAVNLKKGGIVGFLSGLFRK